MQQLRRWGEVVHAGGGGDDGVDQARVLVHSGMDIHAERPLVALLGLMHLRISLPVLVIGGAGGGDAGGMDDRPRLQGHAVAGVPASGVNPPAPPPRLRRGGSRTSDARLHG